MNEEQSCDILSKSNGRTLNNIQSANSIEVKQGINIEQEPVTGDELVVISASTYRNVSHVSNFNERDVGYDFDCLILDEVKNEEKKEYDDKEEEEPKAIADWSIEAKGGQWDQQRQAHKAKKIRLSLKVEQHMVQQREGEYDLMKAHRDHINAPFLWIFHTT